jgi:hypothetical protein
MSATPITAIPITTTLMRRMEPITSETADSCLDDNGVLLMVFPFPNTVLFIHMGKFIALISSPPGVIITTVRRHPVPLLERTRDRDGYVFVTVRDAS